VFFILPEKNKKMTIFQWDDVAYVSGLQARTDLNGHAARVCQVAPRADGRIGVEMFIGQERVWIKPSNLTPIPNTAALSHPPFDSMCSMEKTDIGMFFFANENSTRIPGVPGRVMSTRVESAPPAPAPAARTRRAQEVARRLSIESDVVYACGRCGAHRSMGYRCCGAYVGMNGEEPVQRRNVHNHPDADEDEVDDFLKATIARLDRERAAEKNLKILRNLSAKPKVARR
jgi:hypothetical protein